MGLNDILRQAQIMQKKMTQMQEDLKTRTVEASSGGGMVTVTASGAREILSLSIDPAVVDPQDVDMLQDLILAAVNEALKKATQMAEEEMGQLTGGMKIPGMF
ncbi:YbaB/EbfC family nucleoid-associated protein [Desulfoplanes formicivorans]|uniref:Nucleoid-associated protein DPF_1579 n=1 Tax=Desulfoplanes formicivorans TaxID=1592317 RepID=A0A194AFL0_9BACT|nr:YbaB/EbfC family nucleoid-associated protein [Desulfoplanes formicivorans]GAU08862.1 nucleoid-associated protein DP1429 [Desulfoplanes formicivorans]